MNNDAVCTMWVKYLEGAVLVLVVAVGERVFCFVSPCLLHTLDSRQKGRRRFPPPPDLTDCRHPTVIVNGRRFFGVDYDK